MKTIEHVISGFFPADAPLVLPAHEFPIDPLAWFIPATTYGPDGTVLTGMLDLVGTHHLNQFGAGGKTLADNGTDRYAVLNTTQTQRLNSAAALAGVKAVSLLVQVPAAANANVLQIGSYVLSRDTSLRWQLADVGKTSTNYTRAPGSTGWALITVVLDGLASQLYVESLAAVPAGTLDGTGTAGVTILAGNTNAQVVNLAELAAFAFVPTAEQVLATHAAITKRNRGLKP